MKLNVPKPRMMYAFLKERAGDFILFVDCVDGCYKFLYFPGGHQFHLSIEEFDQAISARVLDQVEEVPLDVFQETITFSLTGLDETPYSSEHEEK